MNKCRGILLLCMLIVPGVCIGSFLTAQKFPTTFQDVSFTGRVNVIKEGYEPFANMSAYKELKVIPGEEHYTEREIARTYLQEQDKQNLDINSYCAKYPNDTEICAGRVVINAGNIAAGNVNILGGRAENNIGGGKVTENNFVTNQSCYPAAKDRHYANTIFTSGKYETISPAFEKGLITLFRKEGECGTIPNDPCGYTCYGIGSLCNQDVDMDNLTRADAEDIYYNRYWAKNRLYLLPDVISTDVFLAVIASGPHTAIGQFREFLGLPKSDYLIDMDVIDAVKNYEGDIHNDWINVRDTFLQQVANTRYGGNIADVYKYSIELKRNNGCHVKPREPLYRY